MKVPIRNVYYLLCYAWDKARGLDWSGHPPEEIEHLDDLLGWVLARSCQRAVRLGVDRGYQAVIEETAWPRGKILMKDCIPKFASRTRRVVAEYDEFTCDTNANRVLKSVLRKVESKMMLNQEVRKAIRSALLFFESVSDVPTDARAVRNVTVHRQIQHYRLPLAICRMILDEDLIAEGVGNCGFIDFERDERFWEVYESFLQGFYEVEQHKYKVYRHKAVEWRNLEVTDRSRSLVPRMQPDIILIGAHRTLIVDAKFYGRPLRSGRWGNEKLNEANLYQIYTYVSNHGDAGSPVDGMLIYPQVGAAVDVDLRIQGLRIEVRTVDLSAPWIEIKDRLLSLVAP